MSNACSETGDGLGGRTVPSITEQEFALFQALISKKAGIFLSQSKQTLVVSRLARRLRALRLSSFSAYYRHVTSDSSEEELVRMLDCISTNETRFFREPKHFEFLERSVLPGWIAQAAAGRRSRRVRVWSAACATGEEPYSIAMVLLYHLPPEAGWVVEVLGTDLSTRALGHATAALWRVEKAREIPTHYLKTFMLKGTGSQEGLMKADARLRSVVRFHRLNLNDRGYPVAGTFDLVLCRNVLIYFNPDLKVRVIEQLVGHLAPDGYFFVGNAESLHGVTTRLRGVAPAVYSRAGGGHAALRTAGSRERLVTSTPIMEREVPVGCGVKADPSMGG